MCVICVSAAGVRQPSLAELRAMFNTNPHGAGFMFAPAGGGMVEVHKGFMTWDEFAAEIEAQRLTPEIPTVYHFRISTQAGVNPAMTHPFPMTDDIRKMRLLDYSAPCAVAHNGIIAKTSTGNRTYSDTALYIAKYLSAAIRRHSDLTPEAMDTLAKDTSSKWAIMDYTGAIFTAGQFYEQNGLLVSNLNHQHRASRTRKNYKDQCNFLDEWDEFLR